ncbi:hypothetical protein P5704_026515 (plasmid) [Pseudomonas sp. FeN3W]|nr:hypothetical protein P5704_026515 [Pseudomonas sp. FeN3W]
MSFVQKFKKFLANAFDQGVAQAQPLTEVQLSGLLAQISAAGAGHTSATLAQARGIQNIRQGDCRRAAKAASRAIKQRRQGRTAKRGRNLDISSFLPIHRAI